LIFSRILRHEWRAITADASLWIILAAVTLAIAYGTFNGARWVGFQRQAIADATREERGRFQEHETAIRRISAGELKVSPFADPRNPQAAGSRLAARYAAMPPAPLAALSIGQSDLLPYYFKITSDSKENVTAGAELENPHRLLTGRFDLAFVLIYVYPLLILALSYNMLSAEREQGTLALALSQPVSLRMLTLAKVTLRFGVFLGLIVTLAGVAALVSGVDVSAPGAAMGLGLWLLAVALYGLFWFVLAVVVAATGRSSATNAMVLASLWLVLVVLLPSMLNLLATTLYPVPSRVEMIQAVREASDEANAEGSKLLSKYYEDHPELAAGDATQAMNDFNIIRVAVSADVERRVRPVLDRYEAQLAGQQRVISGLRFLSPAILMQDALNDIAGTGIPRHRHFMAQVTAFHSQWRDHFVPLIFRKAQLAGFSELPSFRYDEEPAAAVAGRVGIALLGLLVPSIGLAVVGRSWLARYPVVG
jgi:ABC-2 type transport system permease protein